MEKKRDIFIKIEKTAEIVETLKLIKEQEIEIEKLFAAYDKLNLQENKIFEGWSNNLEEVIQKLDHVTL
jgi:hypothetical protein